MSPIEIGRLYDQYGALAYSLAYRVLGDSGAAEDVVQEAFLSVWRSGASFNRSRGSLRTWLCTIVRHRALDRSRQARGPAFSSLPIDSLFGHDSGADTWTAVVEALDRGRLADAMGRLSEAQRHTIGLSYLEGYTHMEISRLMGVPLGTVKGRLRIGLRRLREYLGDPWVPSSVP